MARSSTTVIVLAATLGALVLADGGAAHASAVATPQANGASCSTPGDCASTFCVDGVCCNTACSHPFDTCTAPPVPGTCVQVAPAPPVSRRGLFTGLALLTMIAAAALWHQRRAFGGSSA
ncbi:hypothetical protein KF840_25155 [bacterium]|nr:hypothetical protein [bacterium]